MPHKLPTSLVSALLTLACLSLGAGTYLEVFQPSLLLGHPYFSNLLSSITGFAISGLLIGLVFTRIARQSQRKVHDLIIKRQIDHLNLRIFDAWKTISRIEFPTLRPGAPYFPSETRIQKTVDPLRFLDECFSNTAPSFISKHSYGVQEALKNVYQCPAFMLLIELLDMANELAGYGNPPEQLPEERLRGILKLMHLATRNLGQDGYTSNESSWEIFDRYDISGSRPF